MDSVVKVKQKAFVEQHPKSIASAFLAVNYLSQTPEKTFDEVNKLYDHLLDKSIQETYYGKQLAEMATQLQSTALGQVGTRFYTFNDVSDQPVALSSFKGKGNS
jgi:hypothetical protein